MFDIGIFNLLFDPHFVITAIVARACLRHHRDAGPSLLERNKLGTRMKAVSERREELRQRHHDRLNKRNALRADRSPS